VNEKKEIRRELLKRRAELREARKAFDAALKTNDFIKINHAQERLNAALEGLSELRDDAQDDIGITQMRRSSNMGESIADRIIKTAGTGRLIKQYKN
jgi:phage-related minor tail protein